MQLTRTPSCHQRHDYNIKLTRDELLKLNLPSEVGDWELFDKLFDLINREVRLLESLKSQ